MFRNKLSPIIYVLIALAIIGFTVQLFSNTASLLSSLLMMVVFGAIIYGVIFYFFIRPKQSNDIKKYKKAVKQSKQKYKQDSPSKKKFAQAAKKQQPLINKKRNSKTRSTHLRVIEGNKRKRKNRASF